MRKYIITQKVGDTNIYKVFSTRFFYNAKKIAQRQHDRLLSSLFEAEEFHEEIKINKDNYIYKDIPFCNDVGIIEIKKYSLVVKRK